MSATVLHTIMPFRALTPCICCVSVTSVHVTGDGGESICYLPIIGLNCNSDANSYRKLAGVSFVICTKFLSTDCAILRLCSLFRSNYTTVTLSICHRRMCCEQLLCLNKVVCIGDAIVMTQIRSPNKFLAVSPNDVLITDYTPLQGSDNKRATHIF